MTLFMDKLARRGLLIMALSALSALALITMFIFAEGVPLIAKVGVFHFVFGKDWAPTQGSFRYSPYDCWISLSHDWGNDTGGSHRYVLRNFHGRICTGGDEEHIKAGDPNAGGHSIGGIWVLGPRVRGSGYPQLSGRARTQHTRRFDNPGHYDPTDDSQYFRSLTLALPPLYKEGALALGSTQWQTIRGVLVPAAKSGIVAAIILGVGRAVGETMAVIMVLGNAVSLPTSILDPARTLTTNIGIEMGYASGDHRQALFATGIVLLIIIMILNSVAQVVIRRR